MARRGGGGNADESWFENLGLHSAVKLTVKIEFLQQSINRSLELLRQQKVLKFLIWKKEFHENFRLFRVKFRLTA